MSVQWGEHPRDRAARDMGLTLREYEQYLEDQEQMRYLAEHKDGGGCGKTALITVLLLGIAIITSGMGG